MSEVLKEQVEAWLQDWVDFAADIESLISMARIHFEGYYIRPEELRSLVEYEWDRSREDPAYPKQGPETFDEANNNV